jgi:hypothetical protein
MGFHRSFTNEQYGPNSIYDTLAEEDTNPPANDIIDYTDNDNSDVDGVSDIGSHSNLAVEQYGLGSCKCNSQNIPNDHLQSVSDFNSAIPLFQKLTLLKNALGNSIMDM